MDEPVSLKIGPNGDLFYADITGAIYRIQYFGGNQPPIARISATPSNGAAPLTVDFDGTDLSDADGDPISYTWDPRRRRPVRRLDLGHAQLHLQRDRQLHRAAARHRRPGRIRQHLDA